MKISELHGIGEKTELLFSKLGVFQTTDLLTFYPRTYDVYEDPVQVSEIGEEGIHAIYGTILSSCEENNRGRYKILSVLIGDEDGGRVKVTWFNMPFLKSQLKRGAKYIFRGKVAFRGSLVFMEQPALFSVQAYKDKTDTLQPVYPLTAGLTNNLIMKAVKQVLETEELPEEYLPAELLEEHGFLSRKEALMGIHFPEHTEHLKQARKRIVFDEFFLFTLSIRSLRTANLVENNHFRVGDSVYATAVLESLGYGLTGAQEKVYGEIQKDLAGDRVMNRLVQGDVGSGKTILALLAMVHVSAAGYQSALMAPTEVLARQHYESITETLERAGVPLKVELLTGALTAAKKRAAHARIAAHEVDLIIGTHALISEGVEFADLGLVITDEQHRFGVRQRENLHKKGENPHILVMSATPIPRSLAIILYGDLDISIVDEKPASRLPIKNCVVDDSYHPNAYRFIQKEIAAGRQAYVICAMAKESENMDAENVMEYADELRSHFPPSVVIEPLHGKMKNEEKNRIMERFAQGDIKILVSTTVVEVGINVPNATVMMVENAERFGLSQLHQLRGRVGRGKEQSYCIFVSKSKNKVTKERLEILRDSNDGFYISEQDLKLRGPGDMLGIRQSGEFQFVLGDIYGDAHMLKLAADTAASILKADPGLVTQGHEPLRNTLKSYMDAGQNRLNI